MKQLKKIILLPILLILTFTAYSFSVEAAVNLDNSKETQLFIDQQMEQDLKEFTIPGAVISIVKDDKLIYSNGYGMANIEKNQPVSAATSMFRIASTTKLFTWTAVMQLVEKGLIDLDNDINTYLTSLKIPDTFDKPITMRHLMTHTAGFEEGGVGYQITTDETTLNKPIVETLKKHPLARIRPAGETASYSNYGAALAGLIIEDVSGLTYEEYIQENIFDRLDMNYATIKEPLPKKFKDNQVIGYNYENKQFSPGIKTYEGGFSPAGASTVAADDMAKFMLAHLNNGDYQGKQLLTKKTTQLMHQTAFQFDKRLPGSTMGFQEGDINGHKTISHAGADTMFISDLILIPEQKTGIFISYSGGNADGALASMKQAFFDYYFPIQKKDEPTFTNLTEKELDNYTGSYKFTRRNYSHIDKFFSLLAELKVTQVDGKLVMGQGDEQEFFKQIDTNIFQQVDGQHKLVFKTDKSGKATEMLLNIMPDMPLEKTAFWDKSMVWLPLIVISSLILIISFFTSLIKIKSIKKMDKSNRTTLSLLFITAVISIVTLILLVTHVLNMDVLQRLSEISLTLNLFLFLPVLVTILTILLFIRIGLAWHKKQFSFSTRLFITIVLFAAVTISSFFFYWNLLGWNFG